MLTKKGYELSYNQKSDDEHSWMPIDGSSLDDNTTWGKVVAWRVVGTAGDVRITNRQKAFDLMCERLLSDPTANYHPCFN